MLRCRLGVIQAVHINHLHVAILDLSARPRRRIDNMEKNIRQILVFFVAVTENRHLVNGLVLAEAFFVLREEVPSRLAVGRAFTFVGLASFCSSL
jgi:hypothetical protein